MLRTSQAKKLGINELILSQMLEAGLLVKESRGLYRLADLPPIINPDLVHVSIRIPKSVICLISALNFHNLTTQIPYKVYVALPRGTKRPKIDYPPLDFIWPVERIYLAGIEEHNIDGIVVKIYDKEKTIADCFKYRNKIGLSIAVEALKDYVGTQGHNLELLVNYARIDKVEKIIIPYIEAVI
jgi:predicted transcriptional regulator of viral defense system